VVLVDLLDEGEDEDGWGVVLWRGRAWAWGRRMWRTGMGMKSAGMGAEERNGQARLIAAWMGRSLMLKGMRECVLGSYYAR